VLKLHESTILFFFFVFVFFFYLINLHHYYTCRWWLLTSLVDWIHTSLKFFVRIGIGVGALTMQSQTIQFTTFAEKEICSIAVGSSSQARTLIQWKSWKHDLELKSCSLLGVVKEMCCFTEHSASFPCRLSPHSSEKKKIDIVITWSYITLVTFATMYSVHNWFPSSSVLVGIALYMCNELLLPV